MNTYTIKTCTVKGNPVSVTVPVIGYHQKTGAVVLDIPQMDDKQWEDLRKKKMEKHTSGLDAAN